MAREKVKKEASSKKMSYEELAQVSQELNAQNNYLKQQLNMAHQKLAELSNLAMFKRLDYLFEIVKISDKFPKEFVEECSAEIVETMSIVASPEEGIENKEE